MCFLIAHFISSRYKDDMRKLFLIFIFLSSLFSVVLAEGKKPRFLIEPAEALMDEVVCIRILGLPAQKKVEVILNTRDQEGRAWFLANQEGTVDLSLDMPLEGSCFSGPNPMGLFFFSKKAEPKSGGPEYKLADPVVSKFRAEVEGKILAEARLARWWVTSRTKVSEISEPGFAATLFQPRNDGKKRAAVITLSGSEGGKNERDAALLSSHGYVALALAYFREEGLSKDLVNIPVEIVKRGLDFLMTLPDVDPERIGILGGSKGAELALLAASCFPEIKTVVACVGTHVAWAGMRGFMGVNEPSWTYQDKPSAFVPFVMSPDLFKMLRSDKPWRIGLLYEEGLKNSSAVEKALIPVENIKGAVLLISGKEDQIWPSFLMSEKVMERLREHNSPFPYLHLSYENAGHGIARAFVSLQNSVVSGKLDLGGTIAANAAATLDSVPKMLKFLEENLKLENTTGPY